jgi:hypothetical protein
MGEKKSEREREMGEKSVSQREIERFHMLLSSSPIVLLL